MTRSKMQDQATNFVRGLNASGQKGYLGDPKTVLGIVGDFAQRVFLQDKPPEEECRRMGRIFTDQEEGFQGMKQWNGPGWSKDEPSGLVKYLKTRIEGLEGDDDEDVIANAFAVFANSITETAGDRDKTHERCRQFAKMLVGIP